MRKNRSFSFCTKDTDLKDSRSLSKFRGPACLMSESTSSGRVSWRSFGTQVWNSLVLVELIFFSVGKFLRSLAGFFFFVMMRTLQFQVQWGLYASSHNWETTDVEHVSYPQKNVHGGQTYNSHPFFVKYFWSVDSQYCHHHNLLFIECHLFRWSCAEHTSDRASIQGNRNGIQMVMIHEIMIKFLGLCKRALWWWDQPWIAQGKEAFLGEEGNSVIGP